MCHISFVFPLQLSVVYEIGVGIAVGIGIEKAENERF